MQLATLTNRRPSERLDLLRLRDTKEVIIDDFIVCFLASDAALVPNSDQSIFLTQNHILRIPPSRRTLSAYDICCTPYVSSGLLVCCCRGLEELFFI